MTNRQDDEWVVGCVRRFSPPLSLSLWFIEMFVFRFGNDNCRYRYRLSTFLGGYRTETFRVSISTLMKIPVDGG